MPEIPTTSRTKVFSSTTAVGHEDAAASDEANDGELPGAFDLPSGRSIATARMVRGRVRYVVASRPSSLLNLRFITVWAVNLINVSDGAVPTSSTSQLQRNRDD